LDRTDRYYKRSESHFVGLDELFAHTQKIVLLVGGLLNDVEKCILHDDFGYLHELLVEEQPFVIGIIFLDLQLFSLRFDLL